MIRTAQGHKPVIAQILYSGLGGHGGVAFAMIEADGQRRWQHALGFLGIEPLLPAYAERCADEGLEYHYIPAVARRPWQSYLPVYRWLQRVRPDAVLLHSPPSLFPTWLHARRNKVPVIVVEHQPNELKTRQDWLFSRLTMRMADAIVLLTPRYRTELAAALGSAFRSEKVRVIANGIDTAAFRGAQPFAKRPSNVVRIGMAARFSRTKRFDLMLDMLQILRSGNPKTKWQLSLAGSGEQWTDVCRSAKSSSFGSSLVFEGLLSGLALSDWYRGLDIYCHASDGETLSISVLQAMAAGLPIVGSDVEGINYLLSGDPPAGWLVDRPTGEAFAEAVEAIVSQPGEAQAMGDRAQHIAELCFSSNGMFKAYEDLVAELIRPNVAVAP